MYRRIKGKPVMHNIIHTAECIIYAKDSESDIQNQKSTSSESGVEYHCEKESVNQ